MIKAIIPIVKNTVFNRSDCVNSETFANKLLTVKCDDKDNADILYLDFEGLIFGICCEVTMTGFYNYHLPLNIKAGMGGIHMNQEDLAKIEPCVIAIKSIINDGIVFE